ncbi:hypothetical protein NLG97_g864 [Lecanicillium saksenae]|uniref:Uncharacterized protein n=1 Tax=Lecanicillium saksenae TaxID=468837 RepID=A0ACC1R5C0_9HYPO|nr:hypothetical protein NLG97_g864 [Lecanicillium saksenae]
MVTTAARPVGRPSRLTPAIRAALFDWIKLRADLRLVEMKDLIEEKFEVTVSERAVRRALASMNLTRKVARRIAQQRDPDLRDQYLHRISKYKSWQLIFVDESGCDKAMGNRRHGWALRGFTPVLVSQFARGKRWNILPAYWQGGVLKRWVYRGSIDTFVFDSFIEQLLQHCKPYPEPKSVLVMDNASIHFSPRMMQMCKDAGVRVEALSPYSPNFSPIEENFHDVKKFIRKRWYRNREFVRRDFKTFLEWCVDVGSEAKTAEAHFRHAKIYVEPVPT